MKARMEVLVLNFLLILRLVAGLGTRDGGVVEEVFLLVQHHLLSDKQVQESVVVGVLLSGS